jgi:DNA invertase Pin-like site-specific DNA recombinase
MNKKIIKKILENKQLSLIEINEFISDYVYLQKNKYPTSEELKAIITLITSGIFNITYAATQAALKIGLTITTLYDKNNYAIKVYIV